MKSSDSSGCGVVNCVAIDQSTQAELWARQQALLSTLAGEVVHDLNNLLASVQMNAFLLEGRTSAEDAEAVAAIQAAAETGAGIADVLTPFKRDPTPVDAPLDLGEASERARRLLNRLGRVVACSVDLAEDVRSLLVSSTLVDQGFLTLVVLVLAVLPDVDRLLITGLRTSSGARLTLVGTDAQPLASGALAGDPLWPLTQLVRWLALKSGGELVGPTTTERGVSFELVLPEVALEGERALRLGRVS